MYIKASEWCFKAKAAMQRKRITQKQLAKEIGRARTTVSKVLNGTIISQRVVDDISAYLEISNKY